MNNKSYSNLKSWAMLFFAMLSFNSFAANPVTLSNGRGLSITCPDNIVDIWLTPTTSCVAPGLHDPIVTGGGDDVEVECDYEKNYCFPLGTTVVTCWAKDGYDKVKCSYTVTIKMMKGMDPPTIKCRDDVDLYVDCGVKCSRIMWAMDPVVTNGSDPNPEVSCEYDAYYCYKLGKTEVWCSVKDKFGNKDKCGFTVNVKTKDDYKAPKITCPEDIMASTTNYRCVKVNFAMATATDACSTPTVTCDKESGACFQFGKTFVNCTAKDAAGNESKCTFIITVMEGMDLVGTTNTGAVAADKGSRKDETTNVNLNLPTSQKAHYAFTTYPNPVGEFLNLDLRDYQGQSVVIQLFNTLGQQVYTAQVKEASSDSYRMDTHNLSKGTYYLKVAAEGAEPTAKMIVKN